MVNFTLSLSFFSLAYKPRQHDKQILFDDRMFHFNCINSIMLPNEQGYCRETKTRKERLRFLLHKSG